MLLTQQASFVEHLQYMLAKLKSANFLTVTIVEYYRLATSRKTDFIGDFRTHNILLEKINMITALIALVY